MVCYAADYVLIGLMQGKKKSKVLGIGEKKEKQGTLYVSLLTQYNYQYYTKLSS